MTVEINLYLAKHLMLWKEIERFGMRQDNQTCFKLSEGRVVIGTAFEMTKAYNDAYPEATVEHMYDFSMRVFDPCKDIRDAKVVIDAFAQQSGMTLNILVYKDVVEVMVIHDTYEHFEPVLEKTLEMAVCQAICNVLKKLNGG